MNQYFILEEVSKTSIQLLLKEPFYSHILGCLNKVVVDKNHELKTLAVGFLHNNHTLYINDDFWSNFLTEPKHRYGVLKHEILHIIFKHTLVHEPSKDKLIINIAMDLVVNQYVARENLPDESIFLDTFPELNLEPEKSWQYYYDKLINFKRKQFQKLYNKKGEGGRRNQSKTAENLSKITGDNYGMDRHQLWKFDEEVTGADRVLIDNIIDNIIRIAKDKTNSTAWGRMPSKLQRHIENMLIKPVPDVHWRSMMKLFTASSNKTYVKNSIKRISKRYDTIPGIKIKRKSKLYVAIDTSGSVDNESLKDFFSEIYHIWRSGSQIIISECDVVIARTYEYKGVTPKFTLGGGGTDFNAPIKLANDEIRPDGIIYFTDGYAPVPHIISRCPILWIINKGGLALNSKELNQFPGRKAKLK